MTARTIALDDTLHRYLVDHSVREAPVLAELRELTQALPDARMQIGPEQGQFMQLLVRAIGARRCIEVGVFTGYSSLAVAAALPDDGYLLACDVSEEWTAIAKRFWQRAGVARKIELVLAPATDTLTARVAAGERGSYDFAFIDADKVSYARYYELALALLRPGGVIAVDNTLWSGRVADARVQDENTNALRAFNEALHRDERVDLSLVPIGDGLTLARKR
jgi:caffeoyl-CoA O-methyltransferase